MKSTISSLKRCLPKRSTEVWSSATALREVAGEAAILVDPTDVAAISAGLARLLSAHNALEHFRQLGLERSDQFSWQRAAQETFEVYERVAAGAYSPRPSLE